MLCIMCVCMYYKAKTNLLIRISIHNTKGFPKHCEHHNFRLNFISFNKVLWAKLHIFHAYSCKMTI